jgi:hypothetical protein
LLLQELSHRERDIEMFDFGRNDALVAHISSRRTQACAALDMNG